MLVPSRPSQPTRDRIGLAVLLLLSAGLFFTALDWGLPSRDADRYLFGDRTPWTGEQILALAGGWGDRGDLPSDLDADPLDRTAGPVVLNDTDAKRAAIVLRYRLYSYQPDEMQTFRALASMRPGAGDLDPRFYLYGGLWVYPIGGLLKAASLLGWVTLRSDLPYYLDHPEAFGRFYVVARAYSAAWGVAGVYVCYLLGLRLGGSATAGWYAGLLFALLPVTVNAAHEAKPHLAGAVLSLAAILPAGRYVSTGRRRWAVLAGVLCGAAAGVVLSGASAFVVVVAMAGLRAWRRSGEGGAEDPGSRGPTGRSAGVPDDANLSSGKGDSTAARWSAATRSFAARAFVDGLIAVGAGALVYALTNPYVVMNLLRGRSVVGENVGHLQTFYWPTLAGVPYALALLVAAAGPAVVVAGAVALMISRLTAKLVGTGAVAPTGLLLAALALTALLPFLLLADGKTADYGRFALVPAACSSIGAAGALGEPAQPIESGSGAHLSRGGHGGVYPPAHRRVPHRVRVRPRRADHPDADGRVARRGRAGDAHHAARTRPILLAASGPLAMATGFARPAIRS